MADETRPRRRWLSCGCYGCAGLVLTVLLVTVVVGGVGWLVALVWAKTRPVQAELEQRVAALEARIEALGGET